MSGQARILLVSGSTSTGSTNTAALATAAAIAPSQVTSVLYDGLAELPAFNPDLDGDRLPAAAARLRGEIGESDAVLFCSPEYAGTLPGSLKNLLDWTVGGGEFDRSRPPGSTSPPRAAAKAPRTPSWPCSATSGPTSSRRPAAGSRSTATRSGRTAP